MSSSTKLLLVLIIIFLIIIDHKAWIDQNLELTQDTGNPTNTTNLPEEDYGQNLVLTFDLEITEDTNKDSAFNTLNSDQIVTAQDTGLNVDFQIFDSNDNLTLDIGETTHVKFSIDNNSSSNWTVQDIHIVGQNSTFEPENFMNLKTKNAGDLSYIFDGLSLDYIREKAFILAPGYESSFEFDILWPKSSDNKFKKDADANTFIGIDFIATNNDNAYYFEIKNEKLNFSGENIY